MTKESRIMETYKRDDDVVVVILSKEENKKRFAASKYFVHPTTEKTYNTDLNSLEQETLRFQIIEAIKNHKEPSGESPKIANINYIRDPVIFGDFIKAHQDMKPTDRIMNLYNDYKDKDNHPFISEAQRDSLFIRYLNDIEI